ncbi:hypothetical protein M513_10197 [Trichuris suis]|uniref:Glycosyltransferase 2-like domain-containing protein n=1 Tax=Trichuris suis TaxID=68888 RepID=A0A085LVG0_9BILA|nr:hypothetical protein M513_10197 [Trichuris suis]
MRIDITVVVPFGNVAQWLAKALDSVLKQEKEDLNVEVSLFDDSSTDGSQQIAEAYVAIFERHNFACCFKTNSDTGRPGGVGYAKNQAVRQGRGKYLCFLDADDEMLPGRLLRQYRAASALPYSTIIGSKFRRLPPGSTERYSRWANNLPLSSLPVQIYTSHGPPVVAPTWFLSRRLFEEVGGFVEYAEPYPEDLDFMYRALKIGATLFRVDEELVIYRHHSACASLLISEQQIWNIRISHFISDVLQHWEAFTIWNAGRQGRRFFKSLPSWCQDRVICMCDVDKRKVFQGVYELYDQKKRAVLRRVPIIPVHEANPPLVICVKLDMTNGQLEALINAKRLKEGCQCLKLAKRDCDDFITYAITANRDYDKFQLRVLTENQLKCLVVVNGSIRPLILK